jgi:hypothetical protein
MGDIKFSEFSVQFSGMVKRGVDEFRDLEASFFRSRISGTRKPEIRFRKGSEQVEVQNGFAKKHVVANVIWSQTRLAFLPVSS